LVIARQIQRIGRGALHRSDHHRSQVVHVQAIKHQPWPHHVPRAALRQLQQRVAPGSVEARQAEHRRGDTARIRQCTPLRFGEATLHACRPGGIGHAVLIDPATVAVAVDRGR